MTGKHLTKHVYTAILSVGLLFLWACSDDSTDSADIELAQKLAGELQDNGLYEAAVEEYRRILQAPELEVPTRANINYLIARIYYEKLADYEQAAAYYIRAQTIDPDASFSAEAARKLVASLERMGNLVDARRQLDAAVDLDSGPEDEDDVVVARVGDVPVWLSEIEAAIQQLPPNMQKRFLTKEQKREFVHQHVGMELLYHAALRENYDDDPKLKRQQQQFLRQLLIEKYIVDNVMPKIRIDSIDVHNYYLAHKDTRYDNAPYDSVQAQVFLDYQGEKAQSAFSDYISMLAQKEKVEFLDHNVK